MPTSERWQRIQFNRLCSFSFVKVTAEGEPDEAVERMGSSSVKLYNVSDDSGEITTTEVVPSDGGGLTGSLLQVSTILPPSPYNMRPFPFMSMGRERLLNVFFFHMHVCFRAVTSFAVGFHRVPRACVSLMLNFKL